MKIRISTFILALCSEIVIGSFGLGQNRVWSINDCIQFALEKNIQIQKALVTYDISEINLHLARSAWYPSLSGSVRQNFDWRNQSNTTTGSTVFKGTNGTNISVNSNMVLFNGLRLHNTVRRSEIEHEADKYNSDIIRETVSLNVLNAYLQVLYAEEQVKNTNNQIGTTTEQLNLASERLKLGAISNSDYLQVRSQLATERQTLAVAESQLAVNKITLMQLMELPETGDFAIEHPQLDSIINQNLNPNPGEVYQIALGIKPEVKNAELLRQSAQIGVEIARGNFYPDISLNAGISTLYSGPATGSGSGFGTQMSNNISPALGFTASIPIFLNRQVRSNVEIAKKNTTNAELDEANVRNQLRKSIEQACQDVISSQIEYEASSEAYQAVRESADVASEKFFQGLLNSIDLLVQKTLFISSESTLLQSKYRLIFAYKVLDFYTGKPLSFVKNNEK